MNTSQRSFQPTIAWDSDMLPAYDDNNIIVLSKPVSQKVDKAVLLSNASKIHNALNSPSPFEWYPTFRNRSLTPMEKRLIDIAPIMTNFKYWEQAAMYLFDPERSSDIPWKEQSEEVIKEEWYGFARSDTNQPLFEKNRALLEPFADFWQERYPRSALRTTNFNNVMTVPLADTDLETSEPYIISFGTWDLAGSPFTVSDLVRAQQSPTENTLFEILDRGPWQNPERELLKKPSVWTDHEEKRFFNPIATLSHNRVATLSERIIVSKFRHPVKPIISVDRIDYQVTLLPSMLLRGTETNGHMPGGGPGSFPYPIHRSHYEAVVTHKERIYPSAVVSKNQAVPTPIRVYILDTLYPPEMEVNAQNHPSVSAWWRTPTTDTFQVQRMKDTLRTYATESIWQEVDTASDTDMFDKVTYKHWRHTVKGADLPAKKKALLKYLLDKLKAGRQTEKLTAEEATEIDVAANKDQLEICVRLSITKRILKRLNNGRIYGNAQTFELFDHGPFVADIIYREAPDVELVLVETLNRFASGYLESYLAVMRWLFDDINKQLALKKYCLVNCSFDFPLTEDFQPGLLQGGLLDEFAALLHDFLGFISPDFVTTAQSNNLVQSNVLVFAAAGNDSTTHIELQKPNPGFPAIIPGVFGVGALNERNQERPRMARYSNISDKQMSLRKAKANAHGVYRVQFGEASATGGSGSTAIAGTHSSDPDLIAESTPLEGGLCAFGGEVYIEPMDSTTQSVRVTGGVVGPFLGHVPQTPHGMVYGYAQWSGTSFATALATGIFARYVQSEELKRVQTNITQCSTLACYFKMFLNLPENIDARTRHGFTPLT